MSDTPLLSYIVLSYNYERYIADTLRSIFSQTVQDFEIIVVDDSSTDKSLEVIRQFDDPRLRLIVNELNLGGAASYNRAVQAARGEWLVNLDADDWIAPEKAERQLAVVKANPQLDVIGSYVTVVTEAGDPHPRAEELEGYINQDCEFNHLDTWIGTNRLCRSSTMMRRSTHLRIGLDDPAMVRAPDYELWTRALREGCSFAVIPERLTFIRHHSRGVTYADPGGALLEVTYAMMRNLVPLAEARAMHPSIERMVSWVIRNPALAILKPVEAYRLLGMMMTSRDVLDYTGFRALVRDDDDVLLTRIGRRCLSLTCEGASPYVLIHKLEKDIDAYIEAREYWHNKSDVWEAAYRQAVAPVISQGAQFPMRRCVRRLLQLFRFSR
jgi:glycosyltransferase involved in cell wall biosynthesis